MRHETKYVVLVLGALSFALLAPDSLSAQACFPAPEGLVSWWPGDGGTNDLQGGLTGTLVGGATFGTGRVAQAFSFDGIDDLVDVPANSALDIQSAITLDAWILSTSVPTLSVIHGRPFGYQLNTRPDGKLRFAFPIVGVPGVSQFVDSLSTVPAMTWVHVGATYDSVSGTASIYINGVLEGTHVASGPMPSQSKPLQIGGFSDPDFVGGFFRGLVDEVEVFNRALSAAEIKAIFDAGAAGKCKDGDGDGFRPPVDCDEADASVNPNAVELPGNFVDENCDGDLGACDPCLTWRNHGEYVRCVSSEVEALVAASLITQEEGDTLVGSAARSDIGKRGFVAPECQP